MALFYAGVRFGVIFIFLSRYLLLRMSLEAAALMGGFLKKYLILLFLSNWWVESAKQVCGRVLLDTKVKVKARTSDSNCGSGFRREIGYVIDLWFMDLFCI